MPLLLWRAVTSGALAAPGDAGPAAVAPETLRTALGILRDECFGCHNEGKRKGGLVLTSREALLQGGSAGPVVLSEDPASSPLLALLAPGADPHMPPKGQLTPPQIAALRDWLTGGAPWDAQALADDSTPREPVPLGPLPPGPHPVLALALSPDATRLAVARGNVVAVHEVSGDLLVPTPTSAAPVQPDPVTALAWSPDGSRLAVGGFRRVATLLPVTLVTEHVRTGGLAGAVTALAFSPDGQSLAVGDSDPGRHGYVRRWTVGGDADPVSWRAHGDSVSDLEFSADGTRLVTAGGDRLVRVWNADGTPVGELEGHAAQVLAVAFNTNATRVVSGGADKALWVWDIETREKLITLGRGRSAVSDVAWPGDSAAVFAATDDGEVFRYTNLKTHTGEQSSATGDERQLGTASAAVHVLTVSADGQLYAAGDHSGKVTVWRGDGKPVGELPPADTGPDAVPESATLPPVATVPSSGDGRRVARVEPLADELRRGRLLALAATPAEVRLGTWNRRQGIRLTARTDGGGEVDVTDAAVFRAGPDAPFTVGAGGELTAIRPGAGRVTARVGGLTVRIPVRVDAPADGTDLRPSFVRDVLPVLNAAGCSAGACHAKPGGQAGFQLSVFSFDPAADHAEITREARGRRLFPSAPDQSLLLRKALGRIPHEGGQRFAPESEPHQLLRAWIRAGAPLQVTNEPALTAIEVFPAERTYPARARQRLLVTAVHADGTRRDVTPLAAFSSGDPELVDVDAAGRVTVGDLTGEGVVVARFMGRVAAARVLVPAKNLLPADRYAALPRRNFIDDLAIARFARLGLLPSEPVGDAGFLRRASLDTIGVLPTPDEVRAFLADPAPDKRDRLIDRLLDHPAYADHWATRWADLVRPNPDRVGVKSVFVIDQWLRDAFRRNLPYDRFAREFLAAEGSNHGDGPAVVYRDRREPPELTTLFSQLFLGTRLECARCHHHPNEKWSQDDFYRLAAFFGPVKQKGAGLSPPISAGTETFYFAPGGAVKHPVTGAVMPPAALDAPPAGIPPGRDPREVLADWLVDPANPFFARAAVNRVWAGFFGRGLVEPVDDFRISNPCSHPELLDALAADFARQGYDFKHLIRTILRSRLYQQGGEPNGTNLDDARYFSRAYRRRLPAEVLLDAVNDVTGVPDRLPGLPPGSRAVSAWTYKVDSQFLDAFSRPNPSSDPPCERDPQLSVVQALHLMNSRALQRKLSDENGRAARLAASDLEPAAIVTELYLAALGRPPTDAERGTAVARFTAPDITRRAAVEDVLWALLNSPGFLLNH